MGLIPCMGDLLSLPTYTYISYILCVSPNHCMGPKHYVPTFPVFTM